MRGLQSYISKLLDDYWKDTIEKTCKTETISNEEYLELIAELEKIYNVEINPETYAIKKRN